MVPRFRLLSGSILAALLVLPALSDKASESAPPLPDSAPVATFSILAMDPDTGEIGIGVQSKIVGVGAIVPYARAGVGALATQAFANVGYGPLGLQALAAGMSPEKTLALLVEHDPLAPSRQVGILSADGQSVAHTGEECHSWAGSASGKNFIVQGNLLTGPAVVGAMTEAFEKSDGVLAEKLLAALQAGQDAGGDRRGRQSAALLIVREGWGYGGLNDRFRDIRVDEHPDPIVELQRVYRLHRRLFPRPVSEKVP